MAIYQSHYIIDKHNLKLFFIVQNMKEKEWGKQHQINDNFNKLSCFDANKKGRKICLTIIFRLSSCQNKFNCRKKIDIVYCLMSCLIQNVKTLSTKLKN